ncbi:MAG TPA: sn-glycerol-3-phosphate ABC transporter ATP-binding protein UgpC [Gaiellaceae bacterium]|jgi:multiple sugar transport system ATP-binding protein
MADLRFSELTKAFDGGALAVDSVDLQIADGEFMVLVGPSGSGKTTVLRLTAGLEEVTKGEIAIAGRVVNRLHPMDRDIAMVFQNYALYPHMTVSENMGFGLKLRHTKKSEIKARVGQAANTLGLSELLKRKPGQLSGGQRQRVAMGRAIVREPAVFLMDEPLSNLDAKLRVQMRAEIQRIQHRLGTTTIYVTHDQTEAMTMGDRVAVMRQGRLVQVDTPQALYDRPVDLFVAGFIGSPAMNLVRARLRASNGSLLAEVGSRTLELPKDTLPASVAGRDGREVIVGIRPEHLEDADLTPANGRLVLEAPVTLAEPVGAEVIAHFELDTPPVLTKDTIELARDVDDLDAPQSDDAGRVSCTARLDPRTKASRGDVLRLVVDPRSLYFFDPETETALR